MVGTQNQRDVFKTGENISAGEEFRAAHAVGKKLELRFCTHKRLDEGGEEVTARDCVVHQLGTSNPNRLMIASQDAALRDTARAIPNVPILFYMSNALRIEEPSDASSKLAASESAGKSGA